MASLAERSLRVATSGVVPADDPHVIADMQHRIEALSGLLEVHRCNADPGKTVGECVKRGLCGCSCGLLIEPERP
jgi:hypothetical protein